MDKQITLAPALRTPPIIYYREEGWCKLGESHYLFCNQIGEGHQSLCWAFRGPYIFWITQREGLKAIFNWVWGCDWSRKLKPSSPPIRFKTNTKLSFTLSSLPVFPGTFSLTSWESFSSSDWLLRLINWFWL